MNVFFFVFFCIAQSAALADWIQLCQSPNNILSDAGVLTVLQQQNLGAW